MKNITLLEAVNRLLAGVKRLPLASLDDTGDNLEATLAMNILNQTKLSVLAEGYVFNNRKMTLSPDQNKHIHLPENTLEVTDLSYPHRTLVIHEGRLFDFDNNTDEFSSNIPAEVVFDVEFDDMEFILQNYIMHASRRSFLIELRGKDISPAVYDDLKAQEKRAKALLETWALRKARLKVAGDTGSLIFLNKNIRRTPR